MDLSGIQTLEVPKTLKRPWKTLDWNPKGLFVNAAHFWTKVQKPRYLGTSNHMVRMYEDFQIKPWDLDLFAKSTT
jgi:hypothetical protein